MKLVSPEKVTSFREDSHLSPQTLVCSHFKYRGLKLVFTGKSDGKRLKESLLVDFICLFYTFCKRDFISFVGFVLFSFIFSSFFLIGGWGGGGFTRSELCTSFELILP